MDKHTATEMAYKNGYAKGYADATPKWIPVSERLPELGQRVLCCGPKGGSFVARTRECVGRVLIIDAERKVQRKATHWMPIPEPPKECK